MNAALALMATLTVAQPSRPQLVTLPLAASSAKTQQTLSAWNTVVAELDKRARGLKVRVDLQKSQHAFLVGPAREQARDCDRDVDCLAEIGSALGADVMVIGVVSTRIALLAIRVEDRAVLAKARSPRKGSVVQRAKRAAQRLARRLRTSLRRRLPKSPDPLATAAPASESGPTTQQPPIVEPSSAGRRAPVQGLLYIDRTQLAGVTRLTLDGEPLAFTGEGFVSWPATSGPHTLRAVHLDGRELVKTVELQAGQTTEVALNFPIPTAPPTPPLTAAPVQPPAEDDSDVTGTWWFWTAVGTAVVAGAATAAVLATGNKGGPTPPSETGSIQGSY